MKKMLRNVALGVFALILVWGNPISTMAREKRQTVNFDQKETRVKQPKERKKVAKVELILKSGEEKVGELESVNNDYLWIKFFENRFTEKASKVRIDELSNIKIEKESKVGEGTKI